MAGQARRVNGTVPFLQFFIFAQVRRSYRRNRLDPGRRLGYSPARQPMMSSESAESMTGRSSLASAGVLRNRGEGASLGPGGGQHGQGDGRKRAVSHGGRLLVLLPGSQLR